MAPCQGPTALFSLNQNYVTVLSYNNNLKLILMVLIGLAFLKCFFHSTDCSQHSATLLTFTHTHKLFKMSCNRLNGVSVCLHHLFLHYVT